MSDKQVPNEHTPELRELARSDPAPSAAWWRGAVIGAGALVLALGLVIFIWLTARTLALLFVAIAIAEALSPLVEHMERRMPRVLAVGLIYGVLFCVTGGIGWFLIPQIVQQAERIAEEAPLLIERGQDLINQWDPGGEGRITTAIEGSLDQFTDILVTIPFAIMSSLAQILLVLFMSAYWLLSSSSLRSFVQSLVPQRHRTTMDDTLDALSGTVGGYVRGELISALIIGVLSYAGLLIIGVDYPLVLAVLAAIGELIPVVGPLISAVPAVLVGFMESPTQGAIVLVFYIVLQQIESNIVLPNVMDSQADVPQLLALVALFAGAGIAGLLGAIVAIPLAGALKVLVVQLIAPAVSRWSGTDEETTPVSQEKEKPLKRSPSRT